MKDRRADITGNRVFAKNPNDRTAVTNDPSGSFLEYEEVFST